MSRNKDYQKLLNSRQWKELRQMKLNDQPLCEMCLKRNKQVSAYDVHHIIPVESAITYVEMARLCYSYYNLMSICIPCHIKIHQELMSHTKEAHQQRQKDRFERWKNGLQDTKGKASVDTATKD